jgi:CelD/BcsL family acetyltransferase involved in cellulose biosynthesis
MLNILHKRICYFLKTAYDPSYKKFSPGTILLSNAIKDCFDMNLEEFNLCGIPERYKVRWANAHREVGDIFIFNNTLIGRLAYLQEKLIIPFLRKTIQYRY